MTDRKSKPQPTLEEIKAVQGEFFQIIAYVKSELPEGSSDQTVMDVLKHMGSLVKAKREKEDDKTPMRLGYKVKPLVAMDN